MFARLMLQEPCRQSSDIFAARNNKQKATLKKAPGPKPRTPAGKRLRTRPGALLRTVRAARRRTATRPPPDSSSMKPIQGGPCLNPPSCTDLERGSPLLLTEKNRNVRSRHPGCSWVSCSKQAGTGHSHVAGLPARRYVSH